MAVYCFRISMTIFWKIDVSKEALVKPSLELLMKMPDQGKNNSSEKAEKK